MFRIISLGETLVSEISGSKYEFFKAERIFEEAVEPELYLGVGFTPFCRDLASNVELTSQLLSSLISNVLITQDVKDDEGKFRYTKISTFQMM